MPSVDELLNVAEVIATGLTETNDKIEIDADTRTMIIPNTERIFGVMSDEKGERKYFRCKRFVGNGIDLSKLSLRIVFQNASGLETGRDKYIVTDLATDGEDYVTFSWELSRKVTAYKGIISFVVCAIKTKSDGTITNEWNTTLANGTVLEGLEANGTQEQEQVAKDYYNQLEAELLKVANEQINKVQEVVKTIPSDYTQMQKDVSNLKEELTDGRTDVDGNVHDKIGDAMRGQARKLRENLVVRQKEQPTDPNNNVWISDEDDEVEVPDMGEFNSLKEDLVTYNEQEKYNMKTIPYNKNIMKMKQQSFSINGVEFVAQGNTIKLNGTASNNTPIQLTIPIVIDESDYYTITFWDSSGSVNGKTLIYTIFEDGSYKTFTDALDKKNISMIEATKGTVYFRLYFTAKTVFDNYQTQLMISKTNVYPLEFEEYSEIPKYTPYATKENFEELKKDITGINAGIGVFMKFVSVGDSLSVGYHVKSNGTAVQRDYNHSWGKYVEKLYGSKCYWTGKAGETTKTWLEQTSGDWGLKYTQDLGVMPLYIVTMGANESGFSSGTIDDINSDNPITLYGYVGKLFRELRSISPNCYIISFGVSRSQDNANIINNIYKNVCGKFDKAYYYDVQPTLQSEEFKKWFYSGHYSAVGYMKMGVFYNKVVGDIIDNNTHDFLYVDESDVLQ